ncbi:MAG: hypothetical protein AB7P40_14060 [Chloroflexota bacterium]
MDDMFEEVLAICLDRLADGDDVASCTADFPECPDLEPLLELAAVLTEVGTQRAPTDRFPTWLVQRPPTQLRPTG